MAKLWILAVLAVVGLVQNICAHDAAEAMDINIREQLNLFDKFLKDAESAKYAVDLKKLIELTEGALKTESADEKNKIISSQPTHFTAEFNTWITGKLEEYQVNSNIHDTIEFYKTLLTSHAEHENEIKKAISSLENILKETDLKQKKDKFLTFESSLSADFQKFLKEYALTNVNRHLQKTTEFFKNLLNDKEVQFAKEIEVLKAKTEAALESKFSIDDKNKVLNEVTYTDNEQLNIYLQKKNVEYSKSVVSK